MVQHFFVCAPPSAPSSLEPFEHRHGRASDNIRPRAKGDGGVMIASSSSGCDGDGLIQAKGYVRTDNALFVALCARYDDYDNDDDDDTHVRPKFNEEGIVSHNIYMWKKVGRRRLECVEAQQERAAEPNRRGAVEK
jgi:hypothetical protein